jgi:hypothetical protein
MSWVRRRARIRIALATYSPPTMLPRAAHIEIRITPATYRPPRASFLRPQRAEDRCPMATTIAVTVSLPARSEARRLQAQTVADTNVSLPASRQGPRHAPPAARQLPLPPHKMTSRAPPSSLVRQSPSPGAGQQSRRPNAAAHPDALPPGAQESKRRSAPGKSPSALAFPGRQDAQRYL